MSQESANVSGASFAELFEQSCQTSNWRNKVVQGKVLSVDDNYITIDVGLKSEGRIAVNEFSSLGKKAEIRAGDTIDVYIERYENKSGEIVLSREKALREAAWKDFEKCFQKGVSVMGTMFNRVKGGFMIDLQGTTAFLPGSQVDVRPVKDVSPLMGIEQPFLILKMDRLRENIVVSRRAILEGANAEEKEKVIAGLEEGQIITGIVKNITNYGAFVDIGGIDGLLHNADLAWKRINHPSEMLELGQEVTVKIVKFNREAKRISLGMKQLTNDPWEGADTEFAVGTKSKGKVTNVTDYGIFVEVKDGIEGLVYVSEISWKKNISPSKVAAVGDEVEVVVLDIDLSKRRMGLGIKQLQGNPWNDIGKEFPIGHVFDGVITNVADFGIFIKMTSDIDGMVHTNDLSWEKMKEEDFSKYKKGDTITVKVIEIDTEKERISLGVKQLTDNPYGDSEIELKKGTVVTCVISGAKENEGIEVILADGSHGFIKKIDLAKDRQDRKIDAFAVGEKVDAKITSIDKNSRKILLSIKALEVEKEKKAMEEFGSSDSGANLGDILGLAIGKASKKD